MRALRRPAPPNEDEGDLEEEAAIPGRGPETFDISGAMPAIAEVNEDEVMRPTAIGERPDSSAAVDEEINESDLVNIHTGLRLDKTSPVKLMRDRLLSYPAPIWGSKQVMWARVVQYEKDLARHRRMKRFIQEREEPMNLDPQLMRKPVVVPGVLAPTDEERVTTRDPYRPKIEGPKT